MNINLRAGGINIIRKIKKLLPMKQENNEFAFEVGKEYKSGEGNTYLVAAILGKETGLRERQRMWCICTHNKSGKKRIPSGAV